VTLVLKIPELMTMIFSHLRITCVENQEHRYLLNAALTCKDFLNIGLDALWEELDSLMPLLKLFSDLHIESCVESEDEFDFLVTRRLVHVCANFHVSVYDHILSLGPWWDCVSGRCG
jgi:hypothetical protein